MVPLSDPSLPDLPLRPVAEMGLKELERVRLILRGGSVIDWRRLHFTTRDEVDRFLRLCGIDTEDPQDLAWMRLILADALEYLRKTFHYRVTAAVARPDEMHDLFLFASGAKEPKRWRRIACIVLKVMHVIQHIEGRDLLFRLAVSEAEIAQLITQKVTTVVSQMEKKGLALDKFEKSIKSRESLITKLLAKRETVAAQVYDKTRFRMITERREDILPALYFLTQRLFPFNFAVPGETENTLLPFRQVLEEFPHFGRYLDQLHLAPDFEDKEASSNLFSGKGYKALNFIVDVPIRLDAYLPPPELDTRERKGRIGFALVEFQIVDRETARLNEEGENAHLRYKNRQKLKVLRRLSRGLVIPRKGGDGQAE